MHPDQFVVINSPSEKIVNSSINELKYHCRVLDCMNLAETAKIQIHVGGAYGNKIDAIDRFVKIYNNDNNTLLDEYIKEDWSLRMMIVFIIYQIAFILIKKQISQFFWISFTMNASTQEKNHCFRHLRRLSQHGKKIKMEYLWLIIAARMLWIFYIMV
jgi:hypothetical protein